MSILGLTILLGFHVRRLFTVYNLTLWTVASPPSDTPGRFSNNLAFPRLRLLLLPPRFPEHLAPLNISYPLRTPTAPYCRKEAWTEVNMLLHIVRIERQTQSPLGLA